MRLSILAQDAGPGEDDDPRGTAPLQRDGTGIGGRAARVGVVDEPVGFAVNPPHQAERPADRIGTLACRQAAQRRRRALALKQVGRNFESGSGCDSLRQDRRLIEPT